MADVRQFWEANPLSAAESPHPIGSTEYFRWHDRIRRHDVERFALHLYEFDSHRGERVLDVGCGNGWLCVNFARGGAHVTGVDLTARAIALTRERLRLEGLTAQLLQASAEQLPFADGSFDFVVSSGVLHHTPDPSAGVAEIRRVLRPHGRGMISLYYRNWLLREPAWLITRPLVRHLVGNLPGRSAFRDVRTAADFVRTWDGNDNPLGRAYGQSEYEALLSGLAIERAEVHYFPRRFLPIRGLVPFDLHRLLDRFAGTMVYITFRRL